MNFKDIETVKFELPETLTWGVVKNIRNSYSIPVSVNDKEVESRIEELAKKHNARSPLYGYGEDKMLYLRRKSLSRKQKEDLLNMDVMYVLVYFEADRIVTDKNGVNHISFSLTKLRKLDKELPKCLQAPED